MMKLWILGKRGLVGQALIEKVKTQGMTFRATSHDEVDIGNETQIVSFAEQEGITHLINCAAYTLVDDAERYPALAYRLNSDGPHLLGKVARRLNIFVTHLSTDYVFDGSQQHPYRESDPCRPLSVYGHSKWLGEKRLLSELPAACIVRTSWVFGRGGKNFISLLVKFLQEKERLEVIADQTSRATYIEDLCEALLGLQGKSGIFHFANQGAHTRVELAQSVLKELEQRNLPITCKEIVPIRSTLPAPRPIYSVFDTAKVESILKIREWNAVMKEFVNHAV
jgi:dTDP-4-dehydrorhamnose reductase